MLKVIFAADGIDEALHVEFDVKAEVVTGAPAAPAAFVFRPDGSDSDSDDAVVAAARLHSNA